MHLEFEAILHFASLHEIILDSFSNLYFGFKCSPHDMHLSHGDVVIELPVSKIYTCGVLLMPKYNVV